MATDKIQTGIRFTPELLYKIYYHFYSSNNMTLCVAGNVDPERVKEVAEKYFTLKKNLQANNPNTIIIPEKVATSSQPFLFSGKNIIFVSWEKYCDI